MVTSFPRMAFNMLLVLPELNIREMHPDGINRKVEVLYRSPSEDGSDILGWKGGLPAEILPITNKSLYELPDLKALGITTPEQLKKLATVRIKLAIESAKQSKDPWGADLVGYYQEILANIPKMTHAVFGGIHRSVAFPVVVAKWRYDKKQPGIEVKKGDKTEVVYASDFTEDVPFEEFNPVSFTQLQSIALSKNMQESNQIELTPLDFIKLAKYVHNDLLQDQAFFRIYATTGNMNLSPADLKAMKAKGEVSDGGSVFGKYWNLAMIDITLPHLRLIERLSIKIPADDAGKAAMPKSLKEDWIDLRRIQQGSPGSGDILRNLNYFRVCACPELANDYKSMGRGKAAFADLKSDHDAVLMANGAKPYWTMEQQAEWWNNHCPHRFPDGKCPVTPEAPKKVIAEAALMNLARSSKATNPMLVEFLDASYHMEGTEPGLKEFVKANGKRMELASMFYVLASDDGTEAELREIASMLTVLRDVGAATFRVQLENTRKLLQGAIEASKAPPENPVPVVNSEVVNPEESSEEPTPKGGRKKSVKA